MNKKTKKTTKKNSKFQMTTKYSYSNVNEKHVPFASEKISMNVHDRMSRHPYHHASLKDLSSAASSSSSSSVSSSLEIDIHVSKPEYPSIVASSNSYERENDQQRTIPDTIHELSFFPTGMNILSTIHHGNAIYPNVDPMTRAERIRTGREVIATSPRVVDFAFKNAFQDTFSNTNTLNGQALPSIHDYNPGTFHELHRCKDRMVNPPLFFRKDMLRWRQHSLSTPGLSFHSIMNPAARLPSICPQDFNNGIVIQVTSPTTQGHQQTHQPLSNEGLKVKGNNTTNKRSKFTIENSNRKIEKESVSLSDYNQNLTLRTSQELYGTSFISKHDRRNFGLCLYMGHQDDINLSPYQCLLRMQMEFFEAGPEDVHATMQGRNKPITQEQVGIRCRYCSQRAPQHRTRGSTYYPTTLEGIYQACQNMASVHLSQNCPLIPESLRMELVKLRLSKSSIGGGKHYWAETAKAKGIIESNGILLILKDIFPGFDLTS